RDWSSDVCSSDLDRIGDPRTATAPDPHRLPRHHRPPRRCTGPPFRRPRAVHRRRRGAFPGGWRARPAGGQRIGRPGCAFAGSPPAHLGTVAVAPLRHRGPGRSRGRREVGRTSRTGRLGPRTRRARYRRRPPVRRCRTARRAGHRQAQLHGAPMSAASATVVPGVRGGGALRGTGTLLRFMLRRDRIRLPVWLIGISIFVPYFFSAYQELFPTQEDLAQVAGFTSGPMLGLLGGPGYGMAPEQLSYFTFFAGLYLLYILLAAALLNILLVSRHTRVEEQTGRAELIRANAVGAHAPLAATTILAVGANLVLTVLILAGLRAFDAPMAGATAVAAGVGAFGLV